MLWTIVIILAVLWLLGLITTVGGALIHILLVGAIIIGIFRLLQVKRD